MPGRTRYVFNFFAVATAVERGPYSGSEIADALRHGFDQIGRDGGKAGMFRKCRDPGDHCS